MSHEGQPGDFWIDAQSMRLYVYDGTAWIEVHNLAVEPLTLTEVERLVANMPDDLSELNL